MNAKMGPPEVLPFEAIDPAGKTRDCFWEEVARGKPKEGDYYVSGAIPMAYRARGNLSTTYLIVRPTHYAERTFQWKRGMSIKRNAR